MIRKHIAKKSWHTKDRMSQRTVFPEQNYSRTIENASKKGLCPAVFPDPFKTFLLNKEKYRNKRVRVYKGYIFVLCKTSTKALTMYEIPEEFKEIYEETISKMKGKKK